MKRPHLNVVIGLVALGSTAALAQTLSLPYPFVSGAPARASELTANFQAMIDAMNGKLGVSDPGSNGNSLTHPSIETSTPPIPITAFRVQRGGGVVAGGVIGYGQIPASGEGLRMMWHPYKGAFRAGQASAAGEFNEGNIGFYSWAGGNRTIANDYASFAFGDQVTVTGASATGFGANNTVDGNFGFSAGSQNSCAGFVCTSIGYFNVVDGQGATAIGYRNTADADYGLALGQRADVDGYTGSFVWGDASTTDFVRSTGTNQFVARARGGFRFRTNATLSTGCDIAAGGASLNCTSSRDEKQDFKAVDPVAILNKVAGLPITTWKYKEETTGVRHLGPMSQDFKAAFGLGTGDTSIGVLDEGGVALAAIQGLNQKLDEKTAETEQLKKEVATLKAQQAEILKRLDQLQAN
ncbi:tail fiber domain-containing protein [Deinococcus sp. QL22]|uniref:tail fiber domain-containing protein n=1 Tax=Deinococcus sp. QL22 TaxID=2939437 RepID=UPI00201839B0|nr:tail fiber domain-containing protein [Deinococcus sp. QL22]UQN08677.1 tail fiber domain-containing protein [Deinococcus sp. QL22]